MSAEDMFRDVVNDAIARLLPYAPRDFTVDVKLEPTSERGKFSANVCVTAITDIGKSIRPVLQQQLGAEIAKALKSQQ